MKITDEDIKAFAQLERDMDEGVQPFVVNDGNRLPFSSEIMAQFGLENGQTVSGDLLARMIQASSESIQKLLDLVRWPREL